MVEKDRVNFMRSDQSVLNVLVAKHDTAETDGLQVGFQISHGPDIVCRDIYSLFPI